MKELRIDIISDVVCPWCIIGYKRLEKALMDFPELDVELHWQPFELNPNMPVGGENLREHLAKKYGTTLEGSIAARDSLTEIGAGLDFSFNYFDEMRMYNTFDAHQLIHWAQQFGKQTELKLRLFAAFFSEGKAVDQKDVLIDCTAEIGLDADEASAILNDQTYADDVRKLENLWQQRGIHGVPAFIFNQQYLISGAQESNIMSDQIRLLLNQAA